MKLIAFGIFKSKRMDIFRALEISTKCQTTSKFEVLLTTRVMPVEGEIIEAKTRSGKGLAESVRDHFGTTSIAPGSFHL